EPVGSVRGLQSLLQCRRDARGAAERQVDLELDLVARGRTNRGKLVADVAGRGPRRRRQKVRVVLASQRQQRQEQTQAVVRLQLLERQAVLAEPPSVNAPGEGTRVRQSPGQ